MTNIDTYKTVAINVTRKSDGSLLAGWDLANMFPIHIDAGTLQKWQQQRDLLDELSRSLSTTENTRNPSPAAVWQDIVSSRQEGETVASSPDDFRKQVGEEIFNALFDSTGTVQHVEQAWNAAFPDPRSTPVRLAFRLNADGATKLAQIPFEAICSPRPQLLAGVQDELALTERVSIVRHIMGRVPLAPLNLELPLRVLVFAPEPEDLPEQLRLNIQGEIGAITKVVQELSAEVIKIEVLGQGRLKGERATFDALNRMGREFHVFHYVGHAHRRPTAKGGFTAEVLIEGVDRKKEWRGVADVTQALLKSRSMRLLVLNGCETAAISVFASQFPAVVGMQFPITDVAAILFAEGFYRELAQTGQLDDAVWKGRQQIWSKKPEGWPSEHITPVLYMNSEDGLILRIPPAIITEQLPDGEVNQPYSVPLRAKLGRDPYSWRAEGLPAGLNLDSKAGVLDGTPRVAGAMGVRIRVQSVDGVGSERQFQFTIRGEAPQILTQQASITYGDHIDLVLSARGGHPPYRWEADLPSDFRCRSWGSIEGVAATTAPPAQTVPLRLRDARGNLAQCIVPLLVTPLPSPPPGFVAVPGGPFFVGYHPCPPRDGWLNFLEKQGHSINAHVGRENWPAEIVHVDGFFMQQFEVTNEEYAAFVQATGHAPPSHWSASGSPSGRERLPVINVSYHDTVAYCEWKTRQACQAGQSLMFRLPTSWEWEKAAKGAATSNPTAIDGGARLYPWGDRWKQSALFDASTPGSEPVEVHRYEADKNKSPYGVCDLGGNVAEWVDAGEVKDHQLWKHIRGASWAIDGRLYALTFFVGTRLVDHDFTGDQIGFRCVAKACPSSPPPQALVPLGDDAYVDGNGHQQFIGCFWMSRFAVSNDEFAQFKSSYSFRDSERWWPATNVSYREAEEFCHWKSQRDGRVFTLPTRYEWECAVRGSGGRKYPWGNEYNRYRCNSLESGWGHPIDVWTLWEGTTPDGIYNLCGNTSEWLLGGEAVGGSWRSTCNGFGAPPYEADDSASEGEGQDDIGFRYVTH